MSDLRYKEVINVSNGHRLGFVCDALIDDSCGKITALVVPGPARFFGLFGREPDYILPWECISRMGVDIILIESDCDVRKSQHEKRSRR
jgi:YlmC/YmxH family sporulation protein